MIEDSDVELYLSLFRGREDYFAQQTADRYVPINNSLDEFLVRRHLEGDITLGIYVLMSDSRCRLFCVDIDIPKCEMQGVNFKEPETKLAYLGDRITAVCAALSGPLRIPSEAILVEDTGGRGYHIWVFLSGPTPGGEVVRLGVALKSLVGFDVEFFPKQAELTPQLKLGNLIKLPLGIHQKHGGRSRLLALTSAGLRPIATLEANLACLRSIAPVAPCIVREVASSVQAAVGQPLIRAPVAADAGVHRPEYDGNPDQLLAGCTAMRSIRSKAASGRTLSHTEAFSFADVLLSVPGSESYIHETMRLSLGDGYDSEKTAREIERIAALHPPSCLNLVRKGICTGYCKSSVQKRNEDPLSLNTTPCSVWLQKTTRLVPVAVEDMLATASAVGNLRRAYHQLKYYHEYEDAVFFDPFDFEHFERQLEANSQVIAAALENGIELPAAGYVPVRLPKRVNDEREMEYRTLSYSSVYDQVPIQAVFNVVAPILEDTFEESSYGYRWNRDPATPNRIFEDWRTAYHRFRNAVLYALGRRPDGYHISCDIKGFYDQIEHGVLLEQIRQFSLEPHIHEFIRRILCSYEAKGSPKRGLPQGPAYSRVLANLYLHAFDKSIGERTCGYYRYVDDLVLVFEDKAEAEERFEEIRDRLHALGLELSENEEKAARIRPNTDLSAVRRTLDRVHYGMLEGARYLPYQTLREVEGFWDAIERHGASPIDLDQLLAMNEKLPSYLYYATCRPTASHSFKTKLFEIVEFLAECAWFCPKRLKRVFYRLLELGESSARLHQLFEILDDKHKVYFLLSVFGRWKTKGEHAELLRDILQTAASHPDELVWGFAVAIGKELRAHTNEGQPVRPVRALPPAGASYFGYAKWLSSFNYLDQPPDDRAAIRDILGTGSPDIVKIHLLGGVTRMPSSLDDTLYLCNLLRSSGPQLLPTACRLLASATDKSDLLTSLVEFVSGQLEFKEIAVSQVRQRVLEQREIAGRAEIENLKSLYAESISDDEIQRAMLGAVSRIEQYGPGLDPEFARLHREVDRYNGCILYETTDDSLPYDYLEILPEEALRDNFHGDLDFARRLVDDFCERGILPPGDFAFNSSSREIRLHFRTRKRFREVDPQEFAEREADSIRSACSLAAEAYRKAAYFERAADRSPRICPEHLLLDRASGEVVFRSFGTCLCSLHRFGDKTAGDGEAGLAKMVAILIADLLFGDKREVAQFLSLKEYTPTEAFLAMFLENLQARDPSRRYTQSRFRYLVDQLEQAASGGNSHALKVTFLRERLKSALYRYNKEEVSCHGACKALDEHVFEHVRKVFRRRDLKEFRFRRRSASTGRGTGALHRLSRDLFDLSLSRQDLKSLEELDPTYGDLAEMLLLYALVATEILSLSRALSDVRVPGDIGGSTTDGAKRMWHVTAGGYESNLTEADLASLRVNESQEKAGETGVRLSLRQTALKCLLSCEVHVEDGVVSVTSPRRMRQEAFRMLAHACLMRVPLLEDHVLQGLEEVLLALRANEGLPQQVELAAIRSDVEALVHDLPIARKALGISRRFGRADGRDFPPDVRCHRLLRRPLRVRKEALLGQPLTHSFPTSREAFPGSWDIRDGSVRSLVVPSEGMKLLMEDLAGGKVFGRKLSSVYAGRAMAMWDVGFLVGGGVLLSVCELTKGNPAAAASLRGVCGVGTWLLGGFMVAAFCKLFWDLSHWLPWLGTLVRRVKESSEPGDKKP